MPGANTLVKHEWPIWEIKPPLMQSDGVFRQHRLKRRVATKTHRKTRKAQLHELISVKSGVRADLVALVMEALPLAGFEELTTYGESCIENLVMMNENISDGKSVDATFEWHGVVKKAVKEN